jgi:hypothetical protein
MAETIARAAASVRAAEPLAAADPLRPVFHFRLPAQWMNDICGALWHAGWYHIFYPFNPFADRCDWSCACNVGESVDDSGLRWGNDRPSFASPFASADLCRDGHRQGAGQGRNAGGWAATLRRLMVWPIEQSKRIAS